MYQDSYEHPRSHKGIVTFLVVLILLDIFFLILYSANTAHSVNAAKSNVAKLDLSKAQINSLNLNDTWKNETSGIKGSVDIALYNNKTKTVSHFTNTSDRFNTASIVKLSILEATLAQDQAAGHGITDDQLENATPMIENSDNDAATALWNSIGGQSALASYYTKIGASATNSAYDWGLTQTTSIDQLKVANAVAYPGKTLTTTSVQTANDLLDQVEPDQTWGVSGGVPSNISFELKNGWLPDADTNDKYSGTDDWTVNSVGHVYGDGVDYTIAALTDGNTTEQDGINLIEKLSSTAWTTLYSQR